MSEPAGSPLWKKLGWFVALWAGGVLAVSLLAFLVKLVYPES